MSRKGGGRATSLAKLATEFRVNSREASSLIQELDRKQILWKPDDGGWSVAECLDHLATTAMRYLPILERRIERAPPAQNADTRRYRIGMLAWQFKSRMEPPPRSRYRAPRAFRPTAIPDLASTLDRFSVTRQRFDALFASASTRTWWRVRASNPLIPGVRLGVGDWLAILAAHDRRHLWQANQLTEARSFPPSVATVRKPIVL